MQALAIAPEISADPDLQSLVERANVLLEREIRSSSEAVSASWRIDRGAGHPALWLEIRDDSGSVSTRFDADDLNDPRKINARLIRLWGDLLQNRSAKQIAAFSTSERSMDGDEALGEIADELCSYAQRTGSEPRELKLPIRYAIALMKLGPAFWGDDFQSIREKGIRALEAHPLFGVPIKLVSGVEAELQVD